MSKRNQVVGHEVDAANGIITFTVVSGGQFQLDTSKLSEEVKRTAMFHGLVQKVSDKAAIGRDPETGRSATPKAKYEAMWDLAKHLMEGGTWSMRVATKKMLDRAALFQAIATVRGKPAEAVYAKFQDRPDDVLRTFLEHKDIVAEYARLTTHGQPARADELLGELDEVPVV